MKEAIERARIISHHADGKCSMCAAGDEPENGLHRGRHHCGNEDTCLGCHNAGMEYGDQCKACGRIEKHKSFTGFGQRALTIADLEQMDNVRIEPDGSTTHEPRRELRPDVPIAPKGPTYY